MAKLDKAAVARHLSLALEISERDPEQFRRRIQKLHSILTKKPPRLPARQVKNSLFEQRSFKRWEVTLDHADAKYIDEIWADFMSRKALTGKWKRSRRPVRVFGKKRTFEFTLIEVVRRATKKSAKPQPKAVDIVAAAGKMPEAEKEKFFEMLKAQLANNQTRKK